MVRSSLCPLMSWHSRSCWRMQSSMLLAVYLALLTPRTMGSSFFLNLSYWNPPLKRE